MKLGDLFIKLGIDTTSLKKGVKDAKDQITGFSNSVSKMSSFLKGAFAAGAIATFVGGIINVRKEFEKYQAVLKNTFGNDKEAAQSMNDLKQFAAETPFALSELTGAYVKLVNYGLKPSMEEMRKYGDLASSVGKGFDQLTEAIADATTGQFERLKEFGIKAAKEGDKVKFTFKGQSQTIANTSTAIKDYILSLGNMKGVSGSMAAISQTLGGRISNLGDAWDSLMNTLGKGSSGVMVGVIKVMSDFVAMLDSAFTSINDLKKAAKMQVGANAAQSGIAEVTGMATKFQAGGMSAQAAQDRALKLYRDSMNTTVQELRKQYEVADGDRKKDLGNKIAAMIEEYNAVKKNFTKIEKEKTDIVVKSAKERLAELKKIEDEAEAARILRQEFKGEKMSPMQSLYGNVGDFMLQQSSIDSQGVFANLDSHYKAVSEKRKKWTKEELKSWTDFTSDLNGVIASGMNEVITSMGEGIGAMIGSGDWDWKNFGANILKTVGQFMQTLGGLFISYGIANLKFMESLMAGPTPMGAGLAIAAGIGLIAAGAAVSSFASKGMSGSKSAPSAKGYSKSSYSQSNGIASIVGDVVFELKGTVLQGVLNNTGRKNAIIR